MIRHCILLLITVLQLFATESADLRPKNFVNNRFQSNLIPKVDSFRLNSSENAESHIFNDDESKEESEGTDSVSTPRPPTKRPLWSGFNEVDKQIFITTLPLSAIFAIIPLASAIDLFWVNRLGNTLAVAGQAAANQVYSSAFWLFSFLPSVTATLVSRSHARGDLEGTQDAVCQALFFAVLISICGASFMYNFPDRALGSILKAGSPALEVARPYLRIRAFSFFPMLLSFVGFSAFRGTMDVQTSVKVTMVASSITMLLEPLLIHVLRVGVRGAAMATLSGEIVSALIYLKLLSNKQFISWRKVFKVPSWDSVAPLVKGGISLQLRSFCMNFTFLMVARVIQSLDDTGVSAAAHALAAQTFQLGGIVLGALGMAAQTMVPKAMIDPNNSSLSSVSNARQVIKRLLMWGSTMGFSIGLVQLAFLPAILRSSPLEEVRKTARVPALIAIAFQGVNGIVSVGEGIMMGTGSFTWLSISIVLAALGYLSALRVFASNWGLTGVWISLSCFTIIRLLGVLTHLFLRAPSQNRLKPTQL